MPIPGNYKVFVVQSGSMEPKIKLGSLIFVKPGVDYQANDIITFKAQGGKTTVTHRLIEIKQESGVAQFVTKGDANEEADPDSVKRENIIGKTFLTLPWLGYPVGYAQTKVGFILLILVPSIIIIYEEIRKIGTEAKKKINKIRKKDKSEEEPVYKRSSDNILTVDIREGIHKKETSAPPKVERHPPPKRKIV